MAFKMRNSVIKGSRVHKDQIKVQREGYASLADGRAPSSAFQKSAFKDPGHGDKFTDEHFASGKHRSALPKHKAAYLKHTPDHNEETKHPLYERLTEEEKKEYNSLNETEKANVNQNTELHQLKNALGEEGTAEAMAEAAKPFKHYGGAHKNDPEAVVSPGDPELYKKWGKHSHAASDGRPSERDEKRQDEQEKKEKE